jgi:hypothetical protein
MVRKVVLAIGLALALGFALAPSAPAQTVWLCKPGIPNNPCQPGFATTTLSPAGQIVRTENVKPDPKRRIDCFYVYPTVSDDKGTNSDLSIDPEERSIALYQAARYGLHCRVFAPMYRQLTLTAIAGTIPAAGAQLAYSDVLAAWRTYLRKYNDGRGVVLIGHSQGSFILRQLIHNVIDRNKKVRRRLVSAILLGGNVAVAPGSNVGGDFKHIPGCTRANQTGCVIAFSTFDQPVPANAKFGRPSPLPGATLPPNAQVLCTNPAALRGGDALLTSVLPTQPFAPATTIGLGTLLVGFSIPPSATTPWFQAQSYKGSCSAANNAHVLQITPFGGAPLLNETPDQTWGLHLVDANIALGNLTDDVAAEAKAYLRKNG